MCVGIFFFHLNEANISFIYVRYHVLLQTIQYTARHNDTIFYTIRNINVLKKNRKKRLYINNFIDNSTSTGTLFNIDSRLWRISRLSSGVYCK